MERDPGPGLAHHGRTADDEKAKLRCGGISYLQGCGTEVVFSSRLLPPPTMQRAHAGPMTRQLLRRAIDVSHCEQRKREGQKRRLEPDVQGTWLTPSLSLPCRSCRKRMRQWALMSTVLSSGSSRSTRPSFPHALSPPLRPMNLSLFFFFFLQRVSTDQAGAVPQRGCRHHGAGTRCAGQRQPGRGPGG